jgi:hypothetical protein
MDYPNFDVLEEYSAAVEAGDFNRAEQIREGMAAGLIESTNQIYRLGEQAGREAALANQPPLSPEEEKVAEEKAKDFMSDESPELRKSPERQAADDIVRAHKSGSYQNKVMPALKTIDKRFVREYGD